jgi:GTP-binding protein HflX
MDLLRAAIGEALELRHVTGTVELPPRAGRLRARLHELGAVRAEQAGEGGWQLQVDLAEADALRLYAQPHGDLLRPLLDEEALARANPDAGYGSGFA